MLPSRNIFVTLLLFIFCLKIFDAAATPHSPGNSLTEKITALVNAQSGIAVGAEMNRTIKILTSADQLNSLCPDPELSIAGNNTRLTGNKSVIAQCGNKRKFIQIAVLAQGTWWTARHTIKPGALIQPEDIISRSGSLERLPAGLVFNKDNIIGQTAARSISHGQPIVQNQLRERWAITSGREVEVIASGSGFRIRAKGKAMDNAAVGETLRVTMRSGQIMTGTVSPDGKVNINLKE
ncbi:flagellar basal body P-ring formation chaperone FlgA [Yersinia proxima]|uniref:Flagella basal body P-ring formation protein FlgA n=1 Tax=Yersinia proxima TaxID=2890316 RepID=A0ABW9F1M0_9GAMM|nr:flagellar basal body P-ring formation chaperone FlgA [Yersinia proxima]